MDVTIVAEKQNYLLVTRGSVRGIGSNQAGRWEAAPVKHPLSFIKLQVKPYLSSLSLWISGRRPSAIQTKR